MTIEQNVWGETSEGEAIVLYTMHADNGSEVQLSTYGAIVVAMKMPDDKGALADVVLGYRDYDQYLRDRTACGRCVGRTAGRIANAQINIDAESIALDPNGGYCHIDGGTVDFGSRLWEGRVETNRVVMLLCSEDGDQGYPAELHVEVIFDFDDSGTFEITYLARGSRTTVINLTHNIFFNLSGEGCGTILDHELRLQSSHIIETDADRIATGRLTPIYATPLDFGDFRAFAEGVQSDDNLIKTIGGYDHCFVVDGWHRNILGEVATLRDPRSRRVMTLFSSHSAVTINTGNNLAYGSAVTKSGGRYERWGGVALKAMNHPDTTHHDSFPSDVVAAGELYCQKTIYRFGIY